MKKLILLLLFFSSVHFLSAQTIAEIQGTGAATPYANQTVTTNGIVTAVDGTGYFIQDGTAVRSGIYIYDQDNTPTLGDEIELTGTAVEFHDLTEIKDITALSVLSSGNALPAPIVLSTAAINQEDYEGMLVRVEDATCTNSDLGFGEFELNDGSGAARVDDLYFLFSATESVAYNVSGPLYYSFDNYKIVPRDANDIEITTPLYLTKEPVETDLTTATITVEWETNIPANTVIEYGLTPALELGELVSSALETEHSLVLENLQPGTIYYVRPYSEANGFVTPASTLLMATVSESSGTIRVYFNHEVDLFEATVSEAIYTPNIIDTIISYIDLATSTLDFTMYEAQNEAIVDALNAAYDRGVAVRVISDDEGDNDVLINNLNPAIPVLEGNAEGIMHNKFMVVDRESVEDTWVLTGSMNHTVANLGWDYNNVICIQDQSLAKAYTLEFEEMWGSTTDQPDANNAKFGSDKTDNTPHHFRIDGIKVECYFSPSDGVANRLVQAIDAAESELAFAILVFTENSLGTAVKNAYDRGVDVKGIIDYVEFNGSEYQYLLDNNIDVQDYQNADGSTWPNGPTLHHKYAIIDYAEGSVNPLLITGSYNWTASAGSIHDENTLLIYDAEIANWYQQEFWARFFGVVSTNELYVVDQLNIFPNPAEHSFTVDLSEAANLEVYDLSGKIMSSVKLDEGTQTVNISQLPEGNYILKFRAGKMNYIERLLIINR